MNRMTNDVNKKISKMIGFYGCLQYVLDNAAPFQLYASSFRRCCTISMARVKAFWDTKHPTDTTLLGVSKVSSEVAIVYTGLVHRSKHI